LISLVDREIQNKQYTRIVEDHLNKVRVEARDSRQGNDVYFLYLKWFYNKKRNEEDMLNAVAKTRLYDQCIREMFGTIPNNCLHIRSSFYIWRKQK
jgi:hypothetical protein